jgi:hypothetical protein
VGLGVRVKGLGVRVKGLGVRVKGLGVRVKGLGVRVKGAEQQTVGFWCKGLGFRTSGQAFRRLFTLEPLDKGRKPEVPEEARATKKADRRCGPPPGVHLSKQRSKRLCVCVQ